MKVAITADLQFDEQSSRSTLLSSGIPSRLQDAIDCFDWIVREAVHRDCTHLFVLGDIFDNRESIKLSVLDQVCRAAARAYERLTLVWLVGNHDSMLRTPVVNSTQVFNGLGTVVESPWYMPCTPYAFMPWVEDERAFCENVRWLRKNEGARFLLSHVMVEGAVPAAYGRPLDDLHPDGWDRVFLGDVHDPVVLLDGKVQYCGSPMQWHFGDAGGRRGFIVHDSDTNEVEFVENTFSPRFHIIEDPEDETVFGERDFVRVQIDDALAAEKQVEAIGLVTPNVESVTVALDHEDPRLGVSTSDSTRDLLTRYAEHLEVADVPGLVDLGVEILEEVS